MTLIAVGHARETRLLHCHENHLRTRTMPYLYLPRLRKPLNRLRMRHEFYSMNDRIDLSHTVGTTLFEQVLRLAHIHHTDEVLMPTLSCPRETFAEVAICLLILKVRVYNSYRSLGKARQDKDHSDQLHREHPLFLKPEDAIHIVRRYH